MNRKKHKLLTRGLGLILVGLFFCLVFVGCSPNNTNSLPSVEINTKGTESADSQETSVSLAPILPSVSSPEDSSFAVHFIDVGQADSELIICDGKAMLIDGGNVADSDLIYAYLKKLDIHPRVVTLREMARIQSFLDDFNFLDVIH